MVTASHNPWSDNGIKIFAAGGLKLSGEVEATIESLIEPFDAALAATLDGATSSDDVDGDYHDALVSMFEADVLRGLTVVLDCANGAMYRVAAPVVRALGATVFVVNAEPDGRNINANCGATHPQAMAAEVVARHADLGLAFDGDGDRVIAIDELGHVVDGDRLIALDALRLREQGRLGGDTVVVTQMSNLGFHRAMAAAGIHVVATDVGDKYVLEALLAGGFSIGGEQSGHIIYPDMASTGDGLLAGLRLLEHLAHAHRPLSEMAREVMVTYPQILQNVRVLEKHPLIAQEMADEIAVATAELDGEGRILVRASGTEPLIRVMVEAATPELARSTAQQLCAVVERRFAAAT